MPRNVHLYTITTLLLVLAVLLNGVHSKDLAAPLGDGGHAQKQTDDTHHAKITPELHHHSDNTAKIKPASDGYQLDSRSLRLLHQRKSQVPIRLTDRLRHWWQHSLHLG